nr:MAG TPA: hypothetical protein [Caudoviricetes sp.]
MSKSRVRFCYPRYWLWLLPNLIFRATQNTDDKNRPNNDAITLPLPSPSAISAAYSISQ